MSPNIEALNTLADKMGVSTYDLWPIIVTQQRVSGIVSFFVLLAITGGLTFLAVKVFEKYKGQKLWIKNPDWGNYNEPLPGWPTLEGGVIGVSFFFAGLFDLIFVCKITGLICAAINPEYAAMQYILDVLD